MRLLAALAVAATSSLAVPAGEAAAQAPPSNDHYLQPVFLNDEGSPFPRPPAVPGYSVDTTAATTQDDLFNPNGNGGAGSGGGSEPNQCGQSVYGKTAWTVFYADRPGRIDVSTAGAFDSVIGLIPFRSPNDPAPLLNAAVCTDRLSGFSESFSEPPVVVQGLWYAVQVGGYLDPQTGAIGGGPVEIKFEYRKPLTVSGDAILRGAPTSRGVRLRELEVNRVARGARVQVRCRRARCSVTRNAGASASVFERPVGASDASVARSGGASAGMSTADDGYTIRVEESASRESRPKARAARTFRLLRGKQLDSGASIEVRITEPGKIGKYFTWGVRRGSVTKKTQRCMQPFSSRPLRRCG
ncbi:MAG TPA: hypothetical protein VNT32_03035 [Thermoleophilaceae bacterium]|nr:hypothetical protein [Thermoleophilaceae bacterium]